MEKEGFVLKTGTDSKNKEHNILIDTKKNDIYPKVNAMAGIGSLAVRYRGYDGYLIWRPGEDRFKFYSYHARKIDNEIVPRGMINVRGNYLTRDTNDGKPLDMTMEGFMKTLSKRGEINPELRAALEKEEKERKTKTETEIDPKKEQLQVQEKENPDSKAGDVIVTDESHKNKSLEGGADELVKEMFGASSIEGASEEDYLKEIEAHISSGRFVNVKVEGEEGWRIVGINSGLGMAMVKYRDEDGIKTIPFKKLREWNTDLFEERLTQKEIKACNIYEDGAKEMVEYIKNINWSEFGYDPHDIPDLTEINIRAYFTRLKGEMVEERYFENEKKVDLAIKKIIETSNLDFGVF